MNTATTTATTISYEPDTDERDLFTPDSPLLHSFKFQEPQERCVHEDWVTVAKAEAKGANTWKFPCVCLLRVMLSRSNAQIVLSRPGQPYDDIVINFCPTYVYEMSMEKRWWPFHDDYIFTLKVPWCSLLEVKSLEMVVNDLKFKLEDHVLKKEPEGGGGLSFSRFSLTVPASCQKQSASPPNQEHLPFYLKEIKVWTTKDVVQWLDVCYLFDGLTAAEKAHDKYRCFKRTMRASTKFKTYFEKKCPNGEALLAFNTNQVDLTGSPTENSQILAEVKAIQNATKFDFRRRVVFERLFMFSQNGATNTMELAEKLCSSQAIQKHYLNLEEMTDPVEISLIATQLEVSETTRAAAAMLPSRFLPTNGFYHIALRVGKYVYDWTSSSAVNPRLYKVGSNGAVIEYPISTPLHPIKDKEQLQTWITVLSNVIAMYNTLKMYSQWYTNCQTFIGDVISSLQGHITIHPAVEKYLQEMTKTCAPYVQIKVDKSFVDRLQQLGVATPNNVIDFANYTQLDNFLKSAAPKLSHLENEFPDNCYLLRCFYKAMLLRQCKNTAC